VSFCLFTHENALAAAGEKVFEFIPTLAPRLGLVKAFVGCNSPLLE
jgi:hypothetical protein